MTGGYLPWAIILQPDDMFVRAVVCVSVGAACTKAGNVHFPFRARLALELSQNSLAPRNHQTFIQNFPTSSLHLLTRNNVEAVYSCHPKRFISKSFS